MVHARSTLRAVLGSIGLDLLRLEHPQNWSPTKSKPGKFHKKRTRAWRGTNSSFSLWKPFP
jgi:hypothetical protein